MTKKEISQAKTIYDLRELYRKHYPKNPVWKCEAWAGKIIKARTNKQQKKD